MRLLYVSLSAVAAAAVLGWLERGHLGPWAGDWTPNIGTEAITILVTVAVVDRIIARREQARFRPRVDRAMRDVGSSYRMMVRVIAMDYTMTHRETFVNVPASSLRLLDHWLAGQATEDAPRQLDKNGVPSVVNAALSTASDFNVLRERDRDVLDPELVAQMDAYEEDARMAFAITGSDDRAVQQMAQAAVEEAVLGTAALGAILVRINPDWDEEGPLFPDDTLRGTWSTTVVRSHLMGRDG